MTNGQTSIPLLAYAGDSAPTSLASQQCVKLTPTPTTTVLTEDQPAFTMTKVFVEMAVEFQQESDRELIDNTALLLVLTRGDVNQLQLQDALNGVVWDATPTEGGLRLDQAQASQKIPVTIIGGEVSFAISEGETASTFGGVVRFRYCGSPISDEIVDGGRPFTFPANVGWNWWIYNYGPTVTSATALASGITRHWGKWL